MKYYFSSFIIVITLTSQLAQADAIKEYLDKTTNEVVKVCSVDTDGTVHVSQNCETTWEIKVGLSKPKPIYARKPTELTEVTRLQEANHIHIYGRKEARYVILDHVLGEVTFTTADDRSSLTVISTSKDSLHKFSEGSSWLAGNSELATEVSEVGGYKIGDKYCLNKSPFEGFPSGIPVKISHLFNKDHFAIIDSVSDGFLGFGNIFKFYYTELSSLEKCKEGETGSVSLDPAKQIHTSPPQKVEDIQVKDDKGIKEIPSIDGESVKQNELASPVISK